MKLIKKIGSPLFHCFAVPVFFIVHNYFDFLGLVPFKELTGSVIGWLIAPALLVFFFNLLFRNKDNSALFTTFLLIIYFFFSSALMAIKNVPALSLLTHYSVILPIIFILVITVFFLLRKKEQSYPSLHNYLSLTSLVLILFELVQPVIKGKEYYKTRNQFKTENAPVLNPVTTSDSLPDIYYIIFDEHPSTASVKTITGYDNSALDSGLQQLGFRVSPLSTSGFSITIPSLCSVFDMGEYPYSYNEQVSFKEVYQANQLLYNSQLMPFLRRSGYTTINASSFNFHQQPGIGSTEGWWGEAADMIRNQTFFNRLKLDIGWVFMKYLLALFPNEIKKYIELDLYNIKRAKSIIDSSLSLKNAQPKFVFAHFSLPHDPFKFDSTGTTPKWNLKIYEQNVADGSAYIQQLAYTRKMIITLAKEIQEKNQRPAVIIIQGDHGMRKYNREKFGNDHIYKNLSALYFPDKDYHAITDSLFLPNTFRIVLNKYMKQQLPLQKPWHNRMKLEY